MAATVVFTPPISDVYSSFARSASASPSRTLASAIAYCALHFFASSSGPAPVDARRSASAFW